jgi:hypothetical protein
MLFMFQNALQPNAHVDVQVLIRCSTTLFFTVGLNATLKLTAEPQTKNGKVYWNVVNFKTRVNSLDNFELKFDNLFNGDKALSKYKKSMQPHVAQPHVA